MIEQWRESGGTFRHRGHSIFYRDGGGPAMEAVVCMHGFPTASWDWHALWAELTARWRVIAPDMLGYGFSDKPRDYDYSLFDQADLYEALLTSLGIERVHILAHDVGDTVAQELLARGRVRIESVCLLNGGLFPETHRPTLTQKLLISPIGSLVSALMTERKFRSSLSLVFGPRTKPSDEELSDFWTLVRVNGGHRMTYKLIRYIEERHQNRQRWVAALHTSIPLRVVNGSDDPVSGAHMIERLRQEIPSVDVVSLPGIGHYPQLEDPPAVLRAYLEFRSSVAARASAKSS